MRLPTQDKKAKDYFEALRPSKPLENIGSILITHFLPGKKLFVEAVDAIAPIKVTIPKPSSIKHTEMIAIQSDFPVETMAREQATPRLTTILEKASDDCKLVLIDIGGYFAEILDQERELVEQKVIGVIEDTINGEKKYDRIKKPFPVPVASVARSPLKAPEDRNVGKAIVYSVDTIARDFDTILHGKRCLVIGYGPVGAGIADDLRSRHAYVRISDNDPIARVHAAANGYRLRAQNKSLDDFDFIFCATGGGSLGKEDFHNLKPGCFVSTSTSSDDEFEEDALEGFSSVNINPNVWEYQDGENPPFYLINNGKAANFVHDAVVGEFIYLVQGEITQLITHIVNNQKELSKDHIITLPDDIRRNVAEKWEEIWNVGTLHNTRTVTQP